MVSPDSLRTMADGNNPYTLSNAGEDELEARDPPLRFDQIGCDLSWSDRVLGNISWHETPLGPQSLIKNDLEIFKSGFQQGYRFICGS